MIRMQFSWKRIAILLLAVAALTSCSAKREEPNAVSPDTGVTEKAGNSKEFNLDNQPYLGNPDAPVQIIEFADYKCPACKRWKDEVLTLLQESYIDGGQAVYYYIDLPFLAPDSTLAALAGETLYQQAPAYFWTYFDLMMEHQGKKDEEWANRDFIIQLVADEIPEANLEQFTQELDEEKYLPQIEQDVQIADAHKVDGTPSVFVNGLLVEDTSYEGIKAAIDKLLKQ